jgi:hypothetical protein
MLTKIKIINKKHKIKLLKKLKRKLLHQRIKNDLLIVSYLKSLFCILEYIFLRKWLFINVKMIKINMKK